MHQTKKKSNELERHKEDKNPTKVDDLPSNKINALITNGHILDE